MNKRLLFIACLLIADACELAVDPGGLEMVPSLPPLQSFGA